MKTTKPGFHYSPIAFSEYPSNRKNCIVTTINQYLEITKDLRITYQLIISYKKAHNGVITSNDKQVVQSHTWESRN